MKISRRSSLAAALLGTFAAPFLTIVADAKPKDDAPAYGYRDKRDQRDRDKRDRDDDRDPDARGNRNISVDGVVTRDLSGSDRFTVRLDNGRTVEVISRDREPVRLSRGDRVRLRGDFERELFIADRVRILDNKGNENGGNGDNENRTVLGGYVTQDYARRDFELVTAKGERIRVRSLRAEPIRLSKGDKVEVRGHFEGKLFMARGVEITGQDDRQRVDFPATVLRRSDAGRIVVRGENGREYVVISNTPLTRFDRDDRVRVKGFINGDIVAADSVTLLRNR